MAFLRFFLKKPLFFVALFFYRNIIFRVVVNMRKINRNICEGPMFLNILLYTFPIILTGVLQLLYNAADLVIVGIYCGSVSVAAVGATGSLTTLLVNFVTGLSVGGSVCVAQAIGAKDEKRASRAIHTAIPIAAIGGFLVGVIGFVFSNNLLMMMGTPDDVLPLSSLYMKIMFAAKPFSMLSVFGAAVLRALGDTKRPMIYFSVSGIANVIMNIFFVTVFDMNVGGVALATGISQAISAFLIIHALMKRKDAYAFSFKKLKVDPVMLKKILHIGIPSGVQSSLFAFSNVIIQSSVNSFGSVFMSGYAAAANIDGFLYQTGNSFYQTSLVFSGQNYGAKKFSRIKRTYITCAFAATVTVASLALLVRLFGRQLLSIYINDSPQAIEYGLMRMSIMATMYFLCSVMEVSVGVIRGMGVSIAPLFITVFGSCVLRVAWVYTIFSAFRTPECLIVSYPISWIITIIALAIAFVIIYKKKKKESQIEEAPATA